ncbi:MAG: NAD-dependent epimerase/dehydratase family protein [Anaerolineales bacterium]|nr:NAD-dependent epimerase/dehydratase family protein [Anaerolineales bacterium]
MEALNLAEPIVVTGATGFIGRWLVRRLAAEGRYVRALVLPDEKITGLWAGPVEVRRGDITDPQAVAQAVRHAGTILHLAAAVGDWGPEAWFQRVTVAGTRHVLEAGGAGAARIVVVSSYTVYGDKIPTHVCHEDLAWGEAQSAYSRAKQAQETVTWQLAGERGLRVAVIRPTNVYGVGCRPWVREAAAELRRGVPAVIGGLAQDAALCYVDNLIDLLLLAAAHPAAVGRTYNANDENGVTWRQYFTDLARLAGARPPGRVPRWLARAAAGGAEAVWRWRGSQRRPPLTREAVNLVGAHNRVPAARARQELGFTPRVAYAEALAALDANAQEAGLRG